MSSSPITLHANCVSANACSNIQDLLPDATEGYAAQGPQTQFGFVRSTDLAKGELKAIFNLTKENVSKYYSDWDDEEKIEELKCNTTRYLLVEQEEDTDEIEYKAIASFRFEMDDFGILPILYCYELQVAESSRGKGYGQLLLKSLEAIGVHRGMKQVVLTVQKANLPARQFYKKMGYVDDETDPTLCDPEHPDLYDYFILSKFLS
eukprot:CFRG6805T1